MTSSYRDKLCNKNNLMEYTFSIKEFINQAGKKGGLLGIDHGTKRIGLSLSDFSREFVFPLETISGEDIKSSALKILEITKEKKASGIVIGYPLQLDGQESEQCKIIKQFADTLLENSSIPIFFQDERLSSKNAQTMLRELNLSRKQRDKRNDAVAACNILQTTLSLLKNLYN
jgi:putative Holliday junction resolvase